MNLFTGRMLPYCLTVVLALCMATMTFAQYELQFEFSKIALQMPESLGRRQIRQNWVIVPHLYQADVLRVRMYVSESTSVRINNIGYSNDGKADNIVVKVDDILIGQFNTHSNSDWGNLWAMQESSGYIGQTGMLTPGYHELMVQVANSADCFGVELWSLNVSVFTPVEPSKFWRESSYELADRKVDCGGTRISDDTFVIPYIATTQKPTTTTLPPSYVKVTQYSSESHCYDKKNVRIEFSTERLAGINISMRHDYVKHQAPQFTSDVEGRLCDKEIWRLGEYDKSYKEFSSIYPGKRLTINLTDEANQEKKFPMKLLPFTTSEIVINFEMPPHVDMKEGSAYLALGLVNVTKPVEVGLQYFDHTNEVFSSVHFIRFTSKYQVFGWNIPMLGKSDITQNTFLLRFISNANVIMFDFLKLLYTKRDERKRKQTVGKRGYWKINGLRYGTSVGMEVNVDGVNNSYNLEDAIIMYQLGTFSRYKTVLRVHSDGHFYPYKTFYIRQEETESTLVDISGFYFSESSNSSLVTTPIKIRSLYINTTNDVVKATFYDGSILQLRMIITADETKLQIISYTGQGRSDPSYAQNIVFVSTYLNDYHAAVNTIKNERGEQHIMKDVGKLSGGYDFTLRKTTSSNLYYANNVIDIDFPK